MFSIETNDPMHVGKHKLKIEVTMEEFLSSAAPLIIEVDIEVADCQV